MRRSTTLIGACLLLTGCTAVFAAPNPLETAREECKLTKSDLAVIEDDGRTLLIDHKGTEDFRGLQWSNVQCLLDALDVPASIQQRMGQTRALDGMQEATWDDLKATWTYHPNTGLDLIVELVEAG